MRRNLFIGIIIILTAQIVLAQTFSLKGVLRDPAGRTVTDGNYSLSFKIYNVASSGTALWTETQGSVVVKHGVFSAELGSVTSMSSLDFLVPYWVGISVQGGVELSPRIKLTPSPYAMGVLGTSNRFPSKGNIGAGTTTPSAAMHIVAQTGVTNDLLIEDASSNPKLVVNSSNEVGVGVADPSATLQIRSTTATDAQDKLLIEKSDGTDLVVVDKDGNVGVGVSVPAAVLHIRTADDTKAKLLIKDSNDSTYVVVTSDGKMGVGVSAPNDPLSVGGNLRLSNGGAIMFSDGTSISSADFGGSTASVATTGMAPITADSDSDGDGEIQFITGTTTKMVVKNDGKVGIGTDAPSNKLTVSGDADFTGKVGIGTTNPSTTLHVKGSTPTDAVLFLQPSEFNSVGDYSELRFGDTGHYIRGEYLTGMQFYDADKFSFSGGNVGIGTTSPGAGLHVGSVTPSASADYDEVDDAVISGNLFVKDHIEINNAGSGANVGLGIGISSPIAYGIWLGGNTGSYAIASTSTLKSYFNGNVGIGTSSPSTKLHIKGSTSTDAVLFLEPSEWNSTGDYGELRFGDANHYIRGEYTNGMKFYDTDKFSFSGSNVGIGTTTPLSTLHVSGTLRVTSLPYGDKKNVQWDDATGEFYYDNSSRRYKENIKPLEDNFAALLGAGPKTYTRPGNPDRWEIGFIAEDFHDLGLTKLVDYDAEGRPDGINYEKICLYLTEIVKKQQTQIEALDERLNTIITASLR